MKFQFNPSKANYVHLAAGRVLLSQAGATSFPVRLASEIFQLCYSYLGKERIRVYDPCCGTAYLLTTLGFLHPEQIEALYGSDLSQNALEIAQKNLRLLSKTGLLARREAIEELYAKYGKESHQAALQSCDALLAGLPERDFDREIWLADAGTRCLAPETTDLLICDVPYGEKVSWEADASIYQLLEAQYPALRQGGLLVTISDKSQKAAHPNYQRYKQMNHGKRRISILEKTKA
jgi:23S rRNA (guanine2535-N1)-methyltransferase